MASTDEPVRRFLAHALPAGPVGARGTRLAMRGRIKVGGRLPFTADWQGDGRSFEWRARAAGGLLRVVDGFAAGAGRMDVRLMGRVPLVRAADEDTARSAAGRAAVEGALWAPGALVALGDAVDWRAEGDDVVVASWDLPPERPEVRLRIDERGAVVDSVIRRWGTRERGEHGYVPMGGPVHEHRRFGDLVIPSRITVGWWYGTPRYEPFFEAEILRAEPLDG